MLDQGMKNLFPQNGNFNQSAYKKMENEWADWFGAGFKVLLDVSLIPPGSDRPTDLTVKYKVVDPHSNGIMYKRVHTFVNESGECFERVNKSDMQNYRS
jgi:DNA/RNA endonuclease G (NUC1)